MKLVITEKPSVAMSIAKVIGAEERRDGWMEGGGYLVSWCVGHLVELSPPESYDERYGKWRYEDLPILPQDWRYQVSASTRKQFTVLKKLMERQDVTSLVCATDAGREGELIFRLVYRESGCRKPFERLWISSMEDAAIREGFANLKPGTEYDLLYEAALCRERADWLVGINATRLFSCLYGQTLNVGRVMTPTLAMVAARDAAIRGFTPEPFYTVELDLGGFRLKSGRIKDREEAAQLLRACRLAGRAVITKAEQKAKYDRPPLLYDLTSLQRDANRILGFTAQQTLDYTQSLYEQKLVTYPRTDSRYLTDDMEEMELDLVKEVREALGLSEDDDPDAVSPMPVNASQTINSKKVTDHHAIIPTTTGARADLSGLPSGERAVYELIATRLVCAVGAPYRYQETSIEAECAGVTFTVKGRTVTDEGWKRYDISSSRGGSDLRKLPEKSSGSAGKNSAAESEGVKDSAGGSDGADREDAASLPTVSEGMALPVLETALKEGKTTPPKRFTEDLLLQAMERASADEFPAEAERKGIGTPATRAATIEKLVQKGFIERRWDKKTRYLCATDKGTALVTVLPEQLQSPSMTAEWEEKLLHVEHGELEAAEFMREISDMVSDLVRNYEVMKDAEVLIRPKGKTIGNCPACGSVVTESKKGWFCSSRDCRFALWRENRYFDSIGKPMDSETAEALVRTGRVSLKGCRSRRTGKTFDATVVMTPGQDGRPAFELRFDQQSSAADRNHKRGQKGGRQ